MRFLALLALLGLPLGCTDDDGWHLATFSSAYRVYWNPGEFEGVSAEQLEVEFIQGLDAGIEHLLRYAGTHAPTLKAWSESITFYVHPGPYRDNDSPTGWASGTAYIGLSAMAIAWKVGSNPLPFPAMGHELGHLWYNSFDFEHTWFPPLAAP